MFIADDYEDLELLSLKIRMTEAEAEVTVAGEKAKEIYHGKKGYPCPSDVSLDSVSANEFDALIIPGGYAPDKLRKGDGTYTAVSSAAKIDRLYLPCRLDSRVG